MAFLTHIIKDLRCAELMKNTNHRFRHEFSSDIIVIQMAEEPDLTIFVVFTKTLNTDHKKYT